MLKRSLGGIHKATTYLNVVTTHVGSFCANSLTRKGGLVSLITEIDLVAASVAHVIGEITVAVNCVIVGLNPVRAITTVSIRPREHLPKGGHTYLRPFADSKELEYAHQ